MNRKKIIIFLSIFSILLLSLWFYQTEVKKRKEAIHIASCQKLINDIFLYQKAIKENTIKENTLDYLKKIADIQIKIRESSCPNKFEVKSQKKILKIVETYLIDNKTIYSNKLKEIEIKDEVDNLLEHFLSKITNIKSINFKNIKSLKDDYKSFIQNEAKKRNKEIHIASCQLLLSSMIEKRDYFISNKEKLESSQLQGIIYNLINLKNLNLDCSSPIKNDMNKIVFKYIPKIKSKIIQNFLDKNSQKLSKKELYKIKENWDKRLIAKIGIISKNYSEEIRGLHPIERDEEIVEIFLKNPFLLAVKEYYVNLGNEINKYTLSQTENLYNSFISFSEIQYLNYKFKKDGLSFTPILLEEDIIFRGNYKEEGVILNSLDELLGLIPFAGDAKEFFNINILKTDKNEFIAKNNLEKILKSIFNQIDFDILNYHKNLTTQIKKAFISYLEPILQGEVNEKN